jgi:1-acyl-sn-glycerol-3-phosphate acyltransferase
VTSVDSSTSTPLPGTGPTSSSAQSTASPSPTSIPAPQPKKKTNVAAIAAGVTVPVVLIALGLAGVLFWRRKKTNEGPVELAAVEGRDPTSPEVYELKNKMVAVEIEGDTRRAELAPAAQSYELGQGTTGQGMTHELDSVPREKGAL